MTIVELHMNIDCDGCEDNVRKALLRLEGVHHVSVDRLHRKVTVTGSASQKKVLRAARRTGRLAVLWPSAYNPAYHHAYAQPAAYYQHQYQPARAAAAVHHHHYHHSYSSVPRGGKNGGAGGGVSPAAARQYPQGGRPSWYNYRVHGYYDSDLYGSYHEQPDVVPAAVRSIFSDENPTSCSVM
ncbi:hypothetical protein ACP4OV_013005 [Aristida adscensionis]